MQVDGHPDVKLPSPKLAMPSRPESKNVAASSPRELVSVVASPPDEGKPLSLLWLPQPEKIST
jgi:hypothetical protein